MQHFQYVSAQAGRCLQVALWGEVTFAANEHDIESISPRGRLYVRERRSNVDRELTVTSRGDHLRFEFVLDGEPAAYDDAAQEWLAELIPEILRESGYNAKERIARIRRAGGVSAVLAEIERTQSTSAKRIAYEALLREGSLSDDEMERVVRRASRDLASSDGEMRAVLSLVGERQRVTPSVASVVGEAVTRISSDGEKRALLQQYADGGDRDMLLMAMKSARQIGSDGEKSGLLQALAKRYLEVDDEALQASFFSLYETIGSDGEKRSVLSAALPYGKRSPRTMLRILESSRQISSDGEKAELLLSVAQERLITTSELRESFMRAMRSISSDSEYRRVMEATLQK
jgi:hypothetical protein